MIKGPGHFLQEEAGPEYSQLIIDFINEIHKDSLLKRKLLIKNLFYKIKATIIR